MGLACEIYDLRRATAPRIGFETLLRILLRTKHITPSGITSVFLIRAPGFPLLPGHHQGSHDFPIVSAYGIVGVDKN